MSYTSTLTLTQPGGSSVSLPATLTLPIESVNFGFTTPIATGTGSGAARLTFSDLIVTHSIDATSPYLLSYCAAGGHYNAATLTVTPQGANTPLITYTFGTVYCTAVAAAGSQHGGPTPTEQVSLIFLSLQIRYVDPNTGQTITTSWNSETGKP